MIIASMQEYLQTDWLRRVQYMSYCTLNIALCELPKIVEGRLVDFFLISEITKIFIITKLQ